MDFKTSSEMEENKKTSTELLFDTVKFPVRYDHKQQTIWDDKNMMVCDIRGWSKIQFMNKSEERQDAIGETIAQLLNEFRNSYAIDSLIKD